MTYCSERYWVRSYFERNLYFSSFAVMSTMLRFLLSFYGFCSMRILWFWLYHKSLADGLSPELDQVSQWFRTGKISFQNPDSHFTTRQQHIYLRSRVKLKSGKQPAEAKNNWFHNQWPGRNNQPIRDQLVIDRLRTAISCPRNISWQKQRYCL